MAKTELQGTSAVLFEGGRGWVLVAVAFGWLLMLGTRLVVPALLPLITDEFAINNTTAGFAVTVIWFAYATMQFPAGMLIDWKSERAVLLASAFLGAVSVVALALAPIFALFLAACVLFGLGTGLFGPPRVTLLSNVYPDNDGVALGIIFAAGSAGAALLPFVAGVISVRTGWRVALGAVVPLFVVALAGMWWAIPHRRSSSSMAVDGLSRHTFGRIGSAINDRAVLLIGGATTLAVFCFQGFTAFLPTYLVSIKGLDQVTASILYGTFFAVSALTQPVAGRAADRFGDRLVLVAISTFQVVVLVALTLAKGVAVLAVLAVLLGFRAGLGPINNGYLVAVLPDDVQGSGYGLLRTVFIGIGATASIAIGAFADASLFDEAFLFLAGLTAVAAGIYMRLPPRDAV